MQKDDLSVLIVEDDANFGRAIVEVLTRMGYKPIWVTKPDEALSAIKLHTVQLAVIDCMLPKMNGRDLALKIRNDQKIPVALMSGIYKDKVYVREALQQTGAFDFFIKPFDINEFARAIDAKLGAEFKIEENHLPIHELFTKGKITSKDRINAINESDPIHGFDLPWLYSLLIDTKISGHLNIIGADGHVAGVGFNRGHIVQVNLSDSESYFGSLLLENGYITAQELESAIASNGGKLKKIGERLIEMNLLSPHVVGLMLGEQQGIRLSKTIKDTSLKINFIPAEDIRQDALINRPMFINFLNDWILSKLKVDWLKTFYLPWMNHTIRKGIDTSDNQSALTLPTITRIKNFMNTLNNSDDLTFEQILSKYEGQETHVYQAFHLLLLNRLVGFGAAVRTHDFSFHQKRITKLNSELEKQNYFERLGLSHAAKDSEVKRTYLEFAKSLHPDKLPQDCPAELRALTASAFEKISEAYEVLITPAKRTEYVKELELGKAELVMEAEQFIEQGKVFLGKGEIKKALKFFEEAASIVPPSPTLRLLSLWARLKTSSASGNIHMSEQTIKDEIAEIPPEDRHSALFFFVKGLINLTNGEYDAARKNFEHAVSIDQNFIEVRRELNMLKLSSKKKQTDILSQDLKSVVGTLFKRGK